MTPLSETISKELKRRGFKFVGPTIVYAWMQAVGMVNDHVRGLLPARTVRARRARKALPDSRSSAQFRGDFVSLPKLPFPA